MYRTNCGNNYLKSQDSAGLRNEDKVGLAMTDAKLYFNKNKGV